MNQLKKFFLALVSVFGIGTVTAEASGSIGAYSDILQEHNLIEVGTTTKGSLTPGFCGPP